MLSPTLTAGLERYQIGPKLRALRLRKKLGLAQLGNQTGLSPALLSKLERGLLFPTLPTLLRIALVFGVGLEHFFTEHTEKPVVAVVRKADRLRFPEHSDGSPSSYNFECLDFPAPERPMTAYFVEFEPVARGELRPHSHPGVELLYVLRGRVCVTHDGEDHELNDGDAMYFDASRPHGYRRIGNVPAAAVVVTTPLSRMRR